MPRRVSYDIQSSKFETNWKQDMNNKPTKQPTKSARLSPTTKGRKMVRIAGLEPANGVFSSLLIIAFLYTNLLVSLLDCHLFASFFSHLWATSSRKSRVGLCQDFGLCRNCVRPDSVSGLCPIIHSVSQRCVLRSHATRGGHRGECPA